VNRSLALVFAVIGTLLLVSISFFITQHQPWMVLISSIVSIVFIGYGFVVKVKTRRRNEKSSGSNS
jgi:predicted membrane protein